MHRALASAVHRAGGQAVLWQASGGSERCVLSAAEHGAYRALERHGSSEDGSVAAADPSSGASDGTVAQWNIRDGALDTFCMWHTSLILGAGSSGRRQRRRASRSSARVLRRCSRSGLRHRVAAAETACEAFQRRADLDRAMVLPLRRFSLVLPPYDARPLYGDVAGEA